MAQMKKDEANSEGLEEKLVQVNRVAKTVKGCLLYTSPSPRDRG